jgi:hypothetical protein
MAVVGDILQVSLRGSYLDTSFFNIFFYRVENNPTQGVLQGLVTEFNSVVLGAYRQFANNSTIFSSITVRNIFGDEEYTTSAINNPVGARSGSEPLPPFVSASVLLRRSNRRVRAGRKHLVGGMESDTNSGYWTNLALSLITPVANAMAADLNPGLVDLLRPVVVGRVLVAPGKYRLPQSQSELGDKWSYVAGVNVNKRVSTQNSRKLAALY